MYGTRSWSPTLAEIVLVLRKGCDSIIPIADLQVDWHLDKPRPNRPPMIRFACPHCQKKIKAPPEGAGRSVTCPRCRNRLVVPPPIREEPAIGKVVSEPTGISSKPQVSAMPPAVPSAPAQVLFHCPGCGRAILLSPEDLNQKLKC